MKTTCVYGFMFLLLACTSKDTVPATIFERKELNHERLLIKFKYLYHNTTFVDSAVVNNEIISSDSITVIIDPTLPGKALPDIHY